GADPPPVSAHVPPGERRIVRVPLPPDGVRADRLVLEGDAQSFDNTLYRAPIIPIEVPVYYVGDDDAGGPDGLRYYVERAFPDTARRKVRVAGISAGEDLRRAPLIIAGGAPGADLIAPLRDYIREGGTLLWVLRDAGARDGIRAITGDETFEIEEVKPRDYAMLGEIRFAHPVFASFADPRYSDFTKIRFWRYRRVRVPPAGGFDVLARFEGGDPALIEAARGEGRLFILASGWSPADSQLARSTKFVPLLSAVLERAGGAEGIAAQYRVGEAVALPAGPAATGASITRPDGTRVPLTGDRRVFEGTDAPGIYRLHLAGAEHAFAVNVDVAESGTAPLAVEELERRGLRIGRAPAREEIEERRRQMRDVELEARQKSWRWLIVAALGILFLETALAGTLARRRAAEPGATT
ncbi:MAG: hypothetical protein JXP34_11610, partial [Planctomycetes bacterium]|nr:hypothetical protein [Planctomycetota bacterium]